MPLEGAHSKGKVIECVRACVREREGRGMKREERFHGVHTETFLCCSQVASRSSATGAPATSTKLTTLTFFPEKQWNVLETHLQLFFDASSAPMIRLSSINVSGQML